jgi:hypothetical protein
MVAWGPLDMETGINVHEKPNENKTENFCNHFNENVQ